MRIVDRIAELPGVSVASATNTLPIDPSGWNGGSFEVRNEPLPQGAIPPVAMYAVATDNYFRTMGTSLIHGHEFDRSDVDHGRNDIVVNQTFAHTLMKDNAIGKEINLSGADTLWLRIVGVVKDMHTLGLRDPIKPMAYLPISTSLKGAAIDQIFITIRTKGDPMSLAPAVGSVVHEMAPNAPITQTRTMKQVLADATADTSLTMTILALAAGVALLLGAIGLYGVIGYVVTQRTKEIGVRIALGAEPGRVGTMILRQGLVLSCLGVAAGLAGAAALSRLMQGLLFEVHARDPLTFITVPIILLLISALATWLPARRAAAVSPMEALSAE
jgi:predicted permease